MTIATYPTITNYQLQLPTFEGPLDLLLRLIERSALPIADVSLIAVTDQFLAHVSAMGGIHPDVLADFTAIGARLVLLKSRSLLPRPAEPEPEDIGDDLVSRLREYQAIKQAAIGMANQLQTGERAFAQRARVSAVRTGEIAPLAQHSALSLARAIRRRFSALPSPRPLIDARQRIPIRVMLEHALARVIPGRRVRFDELLTTTPTREEAMTTFLAVLILVRRRVFDADQGAPFTPIELWRAQTPGIELTELTAAERLEEIA